MAKLDSTTVFGNLIVTQDIIGNITGNADTATKLATARTIDITGDITATAVAFDGSTNIAISASVNNNSHTHVIANITDFTNNSAHWDTAYGWGDHAAEGYVTSSGNTVIGTDTDISTSGATVIATLNMTDGVIQSHSTRTLTLANLGYTGATDADNYNSWTIKDHDGTSYPITSGDTLQIKEGTGIDVNFTADDVLTVSAKIGTTSTTLAAGNHGHAISGITGLQTALDGKLATGANAVSASKWTTARSLTTTLTGNITGSASMSVDGSSAKTVTVSTTLANSVVTTDKLAARYKTVVAMSALNVDWSAGQVFTKTITANSTLTFSNLHIGSKLLEVTGDYAITLPTGFTYAGGDRSASATTLIQIVCTDTSTPKGWYILLKNES